MENFTTFRFGVVVQYGMHFDHLTPSIEEGQCGLTSDLTKFSPKKSYVDDFLQISAAVPI